MLIYNLEFAVYIIDFPYGNLYACDQIIDLFQFLYFISLWSGVFLKGKMIAVNILLYI